MNIKSGLKKALLVSVIGASAVAMTAGPAQAGGRHGILSKDLQHTVGWGQFTPNGDEFRVCDTRKDGHGVSVLAYDKNDRLAAKVSASGYNECTTSSSHTPGWKNLKEGATYTFYGSSQGSFTLFGTEKA